MFTSRLMEQAAPHPPATDAEVMTLQVNLRFLRASIARMAEGMSNFYESDELMFEHKNSSFVQTLQTLRIMHKVGWFPSIDLFVDYISDILALQSTATLGNPPAQATPLVLSASQFQDTAVIGPPVPEGHGPKRLTWYAVYVRYEVGAIQGGYVLIISDIILSLTFSSERAFHAISKLSDGRKEECVSEEDARKKFNNALLADKGQVSLVIPAKTKVLTWEDVYPGVPRPELEEREDEY